MERTDAATGLAIIADEHDYAAVHAILARGASAPVLLRKLMGLFEAYRGARKYGWSRPWNKRGLRTFLAFEFVPSSEGCYPNLAADWADLARAPRSELLASLARSSEARGFVFLHERQDSEGTFEGLTLSFGRVSPRGRRYRDRYDVVVERRLGEGNDEAILVRIFDDPFSAQAAGEPAGLAPGQSSRRVGVTLPAGHVDVAALLASTLSLVRRDALDSARHWTHWTQELIDSFGPRRFGDASVWFAVAAFARERAARPGPSRQAGHTVQTSQAEDSPRRPA